MNRTSRRSIVALLVLAAGLLLLPALPATSAPPPPSFRFTGGALTITTPRWQVRWQNGSLVGLTNRLPTKPAALTVPTAPMAVEQMPSGLGSFHGRKAEGKAQHHPWGAIHGPFLAQHPPGPGTRVSFAKIPAGARLTYRGLKGEPEAVLVQEFTVDARTGDLVIRQRGESPNPGVFGVAFSLLNLRPDIEWAVPYFGGQRWGTDVGKGSVFSLSWPMFWNAGLIIGETPGAGTIAVWAEDAGMRPKYLRRFNGDRVQAMGFEACDDAPYENKRTIEAFAWRFNTFAGNWMEPAARYKAWMVKARGMVPLKDRPNRWVKDIALLWPASAFDAAAMKKMAEIVNPRKILLMDFGWLPDFNRRIPEYRPRDPNFAANVALAHKYGFRVGGYTSMALVDQQTHPTVFRDYGLEPYYDGLFGDKPAKVEDWLVYVHPGSAKWRDFYADRMRHVHETYGLDYLYQDVMGCQTGSAGLVEGLNFNRAVIASNAATRRQAPRAALGGEFWNEATAANADFGLGTFLAWGGEEHKEQISRPDRPHPLLSYLFSDYCLYWPHQIPIRDTPRFHRDQNINEVIGALPAWDGEPGDRASEARVVLERARLWAAGFRPHFPKAPWRPGAVSYLREPASGRIVRYDRRAGSTYCYEQTAKGDRLRYARLTGVGEVSPGAPARIDGWLAYGENGRGPIGLNPKRWYCLFPGPPPALPVRITGLPAGAWIGGSRVTDDYVLVQLEGSGDGSVRWRASRPVASPASPRPAAGAGEATVRLPTTVLFGIRTPQTVTPSAILPVTKWRHQIVSNGQTIGPAAPRREDTWTFGGQTRQGIMVHPPLGGVGSEYTIDGFVSLPDDPRVALKTSISLLDGQGDGVHFVVRVNGKEVWRRHRDPKAGWEDVTIPLKEYAGQNVVLSLALDCGTGGFNTSCDESLWGEARVAVD